MQLDGHIQAIQQDLANTAGLGDEAASQAAQRLIETLGSTLHLRLLDLLGEATLEISGQLSSGRVEVRLAGREPELVVITDEAADSVPLDPGEEYSGRITLRLPESLKIAIEVAATKDGLSVNTCLVRELKRAAHRSAHKSFGSGLSGFAEA